MQPTSVMLALIVSLVIVSFLFGIVLGMVISSVKEKMTVIRYAIKNSMNTMPELLRDLYPGALEELRNEKRNY